MAFVTDALLRKSVVVCQSLGSRGIEVAAGGTTRLSPAFFSRHCAEQLVYPPPTTQPERFIQVLCDYLRRRPHDVLIPTDDATLAVCSRYRNDLEVLTRLAFPEPTQLEYGLDKAPTMQLADRLGIPHPPTVYPSSPEDATRLGRALARPLVVKPRSSCGGRGIAYISPGDDVGAAWMTVHGQHPLPMLQECIPPGPKYDVGVLMARNGQPLATFVQKELRHFPLRDGLSTVQESVHRPDLVDRAVALLRAIGWFGLAEVEFMEDPRTGEALLLELNPRFWASIQLAVSCGVDFPYLLYQLATGQAVRETHTYAIGRRCRWLLPGDLLHFLVNPDRLRMDPPFFEFREQATVLDGFYAHDKRATLGVLLSTAHYLFDADVWSMFRRGRPAAARPVTPTVGRALQRAQG